MKGQEEALGSQKDVGTLGILLTLQPETVGNIPEEAPASRPRWPLEWRALLLP